MDSKSTRAEAPQKSNKRSKNGTSHGCARIILINSQSLILVNTEHKTKTRTHLTFPGGKIDSAAEDPLCAALRELKEECNIDLSENEHNHLVKYKEHSRASVFTHTFIFNTNTDWIATPDTKNTESPTNEVLACTWMSLADIEKAIEIPPGKKNSEHYTLQKCMQECRHLLYDTNHSQMDIDVLSNPEQPDANVQELASNEPNTQEQKTQYFKEILSLPALEYLIKVTYMTFVSWFNGADKGSLTEADNQMEAQLQHQMIQNFCKEAVTHPVSQYRGHAVVTIKRCYSPATSSPNGRIFGHGTKASGLGLQRLWGKIRALLTRDFTYDFDMKNAHPTLALYL